MLMIILSYKNTILIDKIKICVNSQPYDLHTQIFQCLMTYHASRNGIIDPRLFCLRRYDVAFFADCAKRADIGTAPAEYTDVSVYLCSVRSDRDSTGRTGSFTLTAAAAQIDDTEFGDDGVSVFIRFGWSGETTDNLFQRFIVQFFFIHYNLLLTFYTIIIAKMAVDWNDRVYETDLKNR